MQLRIRLVIPLATISYGMRVWSGRRKFKTLVPKKNLRLWAQFGHNQRYLREEKKMLAIHKLFAIIVFQCMGKVGVLVCALDFKSRLGVARAVLGRFDSCTFPPLILKDLCIIVGVLLWREIPKLSLFLYLFGERGHANTPLASWRRSEGRRRSRCCSGRRLSVSCGH